MITRETLIAIYNCQGEIANAKEFILEHESKTIKELNDCLPDYLKNKNGENGYLTLGLTIGSGSRKIAAVAPDLALRVAKEHLMRLENHLVALNFKAKNELCEQPSDETKKET